MFNLDTSFLLMSEYIYIFKFGIFGLIVSLLLFGLSVIFVYQKPEKEKMSVYECGFDPYDDARNKFIPKYYIIGILFVIFDLEMMFLFL